MQTLDISTCEAVTESFDKAMTGKDNKIEV